MKLRKRNNDMASGTKLALTISGVAIATALTIMAVRASRKKGQQTT